MKRGTSEHVLPAAFEIIPATLPDTWVNVSGRGQFLPNKWTTYTVNYGNNGNVDAFFVPVIITITDNGTLETEMIDFEMEGPSFISDITEEDGTIKGIGTINGTEYNTKSIAFIIPVIQANTSQSVHLRIRSSESFYIRCWDSQPLISNNEEFSELLKSAQALPSVGDFTKCMANAALDEIQSYVFSQLLSIYEPLKEYAGCAYTIGKEGLWYLFSYSHERTKKKFVTATGGAILDCLSDATKNSIEKFIKNQFKANHGMIAIRAIFHALSCMWDGQPAQGTLWDILYNMVMSFDPNEMAGPSGFGTQNWIQKSTPVPYTIYFENKSEATAPAHEVYITDTLDLSSFDITDFGFGSFGWGDSIFSPPGSKMKEFSMDIDLRPGLELITRVSGKLDTLTGIVKWEFLSLNPGTLDLEEDPFLGFLPPNVSSPEGEGFVSFSVGLKQELGTGDEIRNKASIVFDANQPIITNEYLNTLDLDVPQSRVYPLEATIDSRFPVDWTGSDEGSGIAGYTIYVLKNDTLLYPWLINTSEVTSLFEGEVGSTYKFYSLAKDHVNHEETTPNEYDAQTTITVDVEAFERMKENLKVWPNPVRENLQVTFSHAPCGMYAIELVGASGSVKHSRLYEDTQLQNGITIDVSDCPTGNYILRLIFGNKSETRKVVVH